MSLAIVHDELLGQTSSVCNICLKSIPAEIIRAEGGIWLKKTCSEHGKQVSLDSRNEKFYHVSSLESSGCVTPAKSNSQNICCSHSTNDSFVTEPEDPHAPFGPACVLLLEITDTCNLECPLCFASSSPRGRFFMSSQEFSRRIEGAIRRKGKLDIVMFSGGEPMAHPNFLELLAIADSNSDIRRIMLNTNGILLSTPGELRDSLLENKQKLEIYLQCDSLQEAQLVRLRGASLVEKKKKAIAWLEEKNIPVTLAAALDRNSSREDIQDLLSFALSKKNIRGVTFQPAFSSGRHDLSFDPMNRLTTPEVVDLICEALPETFSEKSFTNLPCSHPNCAIVSYFYRVGGRLWPLCEEIAPEESFKNRINFTLEDLKKCGCETTELGSYITSAELSSENSFRIVIKPFMDRFNLNRDRTKLCCTQIAGPNGKLMSFCEYNVFRSEMNWNQNYDSLA